MFKSLRPWSRSSDFKDGDWGNYKKVARVVQQTDPQVVEGALESFMVTDDTEESSLFLLMRVMFELPEAAPVAERRQRKGWTNWPAPDAQGNISLAWPLTWAHGEPGLVASYEGSEGPPYPAVTDYRYLLANYPFRTREQAQKHV